MCCMPATCDLPFHILHHVPLSVVQSGESGLFMHHNTTGGMCYMRANCDLAFHMVEAFATFGLLCCGR